MSEKTPFQMVKEALRISANNTAFDEEITLLMNASLADLELAEVNGENVTLDNPLVLRAVITYCRANFGEPDDYDRLKQSYDEQKAQMSMATGFTVWGVTDGQE